MTAGKEKHFKTIGTWWFWVVLDFLIQYCLSRNYAYNASYLNYVSVGTIKGSF
jgi:hypothetical protein